MADRAVWEGFAKGTAWADALPKLNLRLARAFDLFTQATRCEIRDVAAAVTLTMGARQLVVRADAGGGAFTVTLPDARQVPGRLIVVKRMNAGGNAVTVAAMGSQTIDAASTAAIAAQYAVLRLVSDGAGWSLL